jgi:hypothetical protein
MEVRLMNKRALQLIADVQALIEADPENRVLRAMREYLGCLELAEIEELLTADRPRSEPTEAYVRMGFPGVFV